MRYSQAQALGPVSAPRPLSGRQTCSCISIVETGPSLLNAFPVVVVMVSESLRTASSCRHSNANNYAALPPRPSISRLLQISAGKMALHSCIKGKC